MKILFDHPSPFLLTHGGFQIQIEQTKSGLEAVGVEVEFLRWWDEKQTGDLIHYFGRADAAYIRQAQSKKMKCVIAPLLTGMGSRSRWQLAGQKRMIRLAQNFLPRMISQRFNWETFHLADACIALTEWEKHLMTHVFGAAPEKVHVLPNGIEKPFLESVPVPRGQWLVCTATITERKRVLELAQAAVMAQVPLWIIGRAYSDEEPYAKTFFQLAQSHPALIRYEGAINDRPALAQIYRESRGFVLLSAQETRSLSAEEAAACQCPLLLSDLPWAKSVFGKTAQYCSIRQSPQATGEQLKKFYQDAPHLPLPARPVSWTDVAEKLKSIYERVL